MRKSKKWPAIKEMLLPVAAVLLIGAGTGYGLAQLTANDADDAHVDTAETGSAHDDMANATAHAHTYLMVPEAGAPKVSLEVTEDAKSGWNVHIVTENFKFTPENANKANVIGEGHAHLYVDGVKVSRVYGNYFYYGEAFDGTKTFKVTLNANDHSEYAIGETVIAASQTVSHHHAD
jgi:hypothetical protein